MRSKFDLIGIKLPQAYFDLDNEWFTAKIFYE